MNGRREVLILVITSTLIVYDCVLATVLTENLLKTEKQIIKSIDKYLQSEAEIVNRISKIKERYEREYAIAKNNEEKFLENPFNHYVLTKRLTIDYKDLRMLILNSTNSISIINALETTEDLEWPEEADLSDSEQAVLRLHQIYGLDATKIAEATLLDQNSSLAFNSHDSEGLGNRAFNDENFELSSIWLAKTLEQIDKHKDNQTDISLKARISQIIQKHLYSEYMRYHLKNNMTDEKRLQERVHNAFHRLCQGERLRDPSQDANLFCHQQVSDGHPYLRIQRIKEEELNLVPRVVLYHDILSDKEIDVIKNLARPNLSHAMISSSSGYKGANTQTRTGKVAWLSAEVHEVLSRLNQLVSDVTGLSTEGSEDLQVAMYGPAGHFRPHYDQIINDSSKQTYLYDRVATWLTYMNDVKAGGATVFPLLGLSVKPEKGSALFWYNLRKSGNNYLKAFHAGCPVLVGSKWISNKWLHMGGQEFRRACSLDSTK